MSLEGIDGSIEELAVTLERQLLHIDQGQGLVVGEIGNLNECLGAELCMIRLALQEIAGELKKLNSDR